MGALVGGQEGMEEASRRMRSHSSTGREGRREEWPRRRSRVRREGRTLGMPPSHQYLFSLRMKGRETAGRNGKRDDGDYVRQRRNFSRKIPTRNAAIARGEAHLLT